MKKLFIITITMLSISMIHFTSNAQESHGKTLNVGLGVGGYSGYYKYAGRSLPVFHVDYEFDVAKNFTLAPFISFYTYSNEYYWGNNTYPNQWYTYTETVIPVGLKGTYYFDQLLNATSKWDFYLGASVGFAFVNSSWDAGYNGDEKYFNNKGNSAFLDLHLGAEYHINNRLGAFLDLSSGVSTLGLAIHGR